MSLEKTHLRTTMKKINGDSLTPILIFRRLQGKQKFLLESSSFGKGAGRYSFMGMNPVKAYRGQDGDIEEHAYTNGRNYQHKGDLYELLKRLMPRITDDVDFPFTGGAVGYVGYGAARTGQNRAVDDLKMPDVYFNIYDTLIIYDHLENEVTLLHTTIDPVYGHPQLEELAEMITLGVTQAELEVKLSPYESKTSQQQFEEKVRKAKAFINKGVVEQIVLSRRVEATIAGDPFVLYRKLRKSNPSPYMYYMEFDDHTVLGTSPESLVKVTGDKVMVNPIAGTRKRAKDREEDQALERELRRDAKELAEHDMLVELSKEEMNRFCHPETVQVTRNRETVRYEHVMHLVSEVEGTLAEGLHAIDALKVCLPAGTVTGSPKAIAMDLIDELEESHRGIYGGAIGYIGLNGNIDFALTIRTMLIKQGKAYVQAGAGIVKASRPADEYRETVNKARSLLEAEGGKQK